MTDNNHEPSPKADKSCLVDHLTELRNRLLNCIIAVIVIFLSLFYFANDIYLIFSEPLRSLLPQGSAMIATEVASSFLVPLKLTMVLAIFIAMPFILHQVWSFIAPGLYLREKRFAIPLLVSSIALFYLGITFAYFIVLPLVFKFFIFIGPEEVTMMTDISKYLAFVLKLFFAFGTIFEIPVAILLLIMAGITTAENMAAKRPYIIVSCFVVGMLLTPPDVISQTLLAVPMWLLFEAGIFLGRYISAS